MNHAPTPWRLSEDAPVDGWGLGIFAGPVDPDGEYRRDVQVWPFYDTDFSQGINGQRHIADLRLMVHAVNCHDELLTALKAVLAANDIEPRTWPAICCASIVHSDAFGLARAAIAKAEAP